MLPVSRFCAGSVHFNAFSQCTKKDVKRLQLGGFLSETPWMQPHNKPAEFRIRLFKNNCLDADTFAQKLGFKIPLNFAVIELVINIEYK